MSLTKKLVRVGGVNKATWLFCAAATAMLGIGIHFAHQRALAIPIAPSGTVAFEYTSWTVNATAGTVEIGVTMTGEPTGTVSVDYATTTGGTARPGRDYTPLSGSLDWTPSAAGATKTFTVRVFNSSPPGATRTVNLTLSSPMNATLGVSTAVLYITDANVHQCSIR